MKTRELLVLTLAIATLGPVAADPTTPNILPAGNFENVMSRYVPWAGVDAQNNIHGLEGAQMVVESSGEINERGQFAPSVAVGDLNGDGKNDLVVADSRGFFWYYPNSGTAEAPLFTQGEVIPIWLGGQPDGVVDQPGGLFGSEDSVVPRIQLVDTSGTKKLDVVAGTYAGQLFVIPNTGSSASPGFSPTKMRDRFLVNTRRQGVLWCNYLAPFLTSAFRNDNMFDLVLGEGTYSANSIYLLHNTDSNDHMMFNEDRTQKIIPGMGREQLVPTVIDWDGDGKPDVLSSDRTGYINLFRNTSTDPANPTFGPAEHVTIGGQDQFGSDISLTVCDLWNNHLPNLLIGKSDGTISYAVNTGSPGHPKFDQAPAPLKGVLPANYTYLSPQFWVAGGAWGLAYEMLGVTNPALEPGFAFPDGVKAKYALRFWVWPFKSALFDRYQMPAEVFPNQHVIACRQSVTLKMNTSYVLHFWVMAPQGSVSEFHFALKDVKPQEVNWAPPFVEGDIGSASTWTEYTKSFRIRNDPDPSVTQYDYLLEFRFKGQNPFYIADVEIQEAN